MRWTPEMTATLRRGWDSALTVELIAEQLGVTPKAVESKRRAMGLPGRHRFRGPAKPAIAPVAARNWGALKARAIELANLRVPHKDIARELKVARSTVCKWLGIQEYGKDDIQFDPAIMKYDVYQAAWERAAGPKDTHLFDDAIVGASCGKAPLLETHVPRVA